MIRKRRDFRTTREPKEMRIPRSTVHLCTVSGGPVHLTCHTSYNYGQRRGIQRHRLNSSVVIFKIKSESSVEDSIRGYIEPPHRRSFANNGNCPVKMDIGTPSDATSCCPRVDARCLRCHFARHTPLLHK